MTFWNWVFIFMGGIICISLYLKFSDAEKANLINADIEWHIKKIPDFTVTQKFISLHLYSAIAIDEGRKKVCLVLNGPGGVSNRIISYNEILSCEIYEDGAVVTKTVRSSQLGGALIGGLALGGVGAIIGGLSGSTKTSDKVNRIDIRITVNDTKNPLHDVNFLLGECPRESIFYKSANQQARHWHGLVDVLIKRADMDDKAKHAPVQQPATSSLADELKKLAELRDLGVLNAEEFQEQKNRLLS